jgi:hypothetical protein
MERWNRVYFPNFPNPQNAKYSEWKYFFSIWISSIEIGWEIVFIATSLGGCFLLKYFSEKWNAGFLPTQEWQEQKGKNLKIHQIHLMAACQECGDFTSPTNYEYLQQLWNSVHIWHAEDDIIVPFSVGQELSRNLPGAETHFFSREKWYRHFHGVERIVELEEVILVK